MVNEEKTRWWRTSGYSKVVESPVQVNILYCYYLGYTSFC
jgi:hypothetical protein